MGRPPPVPHRLCGPSTYCTGLQKPLECSAMAGRNRQRIFADRVKGARIGARHARERARQAIREADAAECLLWSEQMEGYGGPAQPSPTIGQCLNAGYG